MNKYKLIAIDIDGTLLNNKGKVSTENINSIKNCLDKDVKVCLCTGRNIKNTKSIAKKISKDMPFVCADGSVFYSTKENKVISEFLLKEKTFIYIINEVNKYNVFMEFCTKKHYIKYSKNKELDKFSYGGRPKNIKEKFDHYFIRNVRYVKNYVKFIENNKNNINQFIIAGEKEELDMLKLFFEKNNFDDVDIRFDLWDNYIFIVPKNCNKAYGLNILCDYFNIDIDDTISIGDQMNDIDMIKKSGLGIAMGNAHEEIKTEADFITKSNDENGVAYAIDKFIFNK